MPGPTSSPRPQPGSPTGKTARSTAGTTTPKPASVSARTTRAFLVMGSRPSLPPQRSPLISPASCRASHHPSGLACLLLPSWHRDLNGGLVGDGDLQQSLHEQGIRSPRRRPCSQYVKGRLDALVSAYPCRSSAAATPAGKVTDAAGHFVTRADDLAAGKTATVKELAHLTAATREPQTKAILEARSPVISTSARATISLSWSRRAMEA